MGEINKFELFLGKKPKFDDYEWEAEGYKCPHCRFEMEGNEDMLCGTIVWDSGWDSNGCREIIQLITCVCGKKYYLDASP